MCNVEKIWPKWKNIRLIGEGSFGKVFEIYRNEFGVEEHSALKVISIPQSDSEIQSLKNDGMTDSDTTEYFKGIVNDFAQEIQLMTRLKGNANIVAYEDFAVIEKTEAVGFDIFIRMELLTGLPKYLCENRFAVADVIRLGIDMCKALEACRELNIVHRDIKPDNIFVSATGSYKLGDFGVARTIEKTMAGLSRKGTYSYMAPEIYNGQEYGFEADIYSLGIVLYKMLNNNRDPFLPAYPAPVKYSDKTEAMVKRIQGLPLPMPENADERLAKIIFKACASKLADRYHSPKDLRMDLEAVAGNYQDLQSEVFSENGLNYYTNNSIYGTASGKAINALKQQEASVKAQPQDVVQDDEEATTVMVEADEDDGTVVMTETDIEAEEQNAEPIAQLQNPIGYLLPNDFWECACGQTNAAYVSSCSCGLHRRMLTLLREKPVELHKKSVEKIPAPSVIPPGHWLCSCGRVHPVYVSSCVCGVNKSDFITIEKQQVQSKATATAGENITAGKKDPKVINTVATRVECPTCHKLIAPESAFCGYCGRNLADHKVQTKFCPYCGAKTMQGMKFCGKCGGKL